MNPDDIDDIFKDYLRDEKCEWADNYLDHIFKDGYIDEQARAYLTRLDTYNPIIDKLNYEVDNLHSQMLEHNSVHPSTTDATLIKKMEGLWVGALVRMPNWGPGRACGTVVEIDINYKDQVMAQIMWAMGTLSKEKVTDLEVVLPPPGA